MGFGVGQPGPEQALHYKTTAPLMAGCSQLETNGADGAVQPVPISVIFLIALTKCQTRSQLNEERCTGSMV